MPSNDVDAIMYTACRYDDLSWLRMIYSVAFGHPRAVYVKCTDEYRVVPNIIALLLEHRRLIVLIVFQSDIGLPAYYCSRWSFYTGLYGATVILVIILIIMTSGNNDEVNFQATKQKTLITHRHSQTSGI